MAEPRRAGKRPPNVTPPLLWRVNKLMRRRWFRALVLLGPTITGKRGSNKTQDYGVFRPSLVGELRQVGLYVSDIDASRAWYEDLLGLVHSRTEDAEPHPNPDRADEGWTVRCCYMRAPDGPERRDGPECLVLMQQRDGDGAVVAPTALSMHHTAFEIEGDSQAAVEAFTRAAIERGYRPNYGPMRHNDEPPLGDGETGGNVAVYFYDPDWHNIEICGAMDTTEARSRA